MELNDIQAEMQFHFEAEKHLNKEALEKIWPYVSDAQVEHLNGCQPCRKLIVDNRFPTLYVGPVHDIAYEISRSDATAEWLLDTWREKAGQSCLSTTNLNFEMLTAHEVQHVSGCKKCRRLITFLSRSGGEFSRGFSTMGDLLALVEMSEELRSLQFTGCWQKNPRGEERRACQAKCLNPISIGRDIVILVPKKYQVNDHVKNCIHCQLVLFYHSSGQRSLTDHHDAKTWKFFPVFTKGDQQTLEQHISSCKKCQEKALSRLNINAYMDRAALANFSTPKLPAISSFVRAIKRFWGEWVRQIA